MVQIIHTSSHGEMVKHSGEMVKWCNNKKIVSLWLYGVTIMVKWCREYTQFHMVKCWNKVAEISPSKNRKMVKLLFSHFSIPSFVPPSNDGYQDRFLNPTAAASVASASVIYGWCRFDCIIIPQASPIPFDTVSPPCFQLINLSFPFLITPPTPGGVVPFGTLLYFTIASCSCTGYILYFIFATVTYI